jgi:hypothetical protein
VCICVLTGTGVQLFLSHVLSLLFLIFGFLLKSSVFKLQISQHNLDISLTWILLISNEVSNSQGKSVWSDRFFIPRVQFLFHRWCQEFEKCFYKTKVFKLILCIDVLGFGSSAWFVAFNFHFIFYLSFRYIYALLQFLLYIFLLSPVEKPYSQVYIWL